MSVIRHLAAFLVLISFGTGCHSAPAFSAVGKIETPNGHGSGVQVAPNLVLTAGHVAPSGIRHPTLDLSLVAVPMWGPQRYVRLSSRVPREGERLTLVGFGGGQGVRWSSEGLQSSDRGWCTCDGYFGDSGGGVFDTSGRLVGVMVAIEVDRMPVTHHVQYVPVADAAAWLRHHGLRVE